MENINTKEKGNELEKEFAEYMVKELGYIEYHIQHPVGGKYNAQGTKVDIIAKKKGDDAKKKNKTSITFRWLFIISLVVLITLLIFENYDNIIYPIVFCLIFLVVSIRYNILSENSFDYGWVECKNLKTKADINQITKMLREFSDYSHTGSKELNVKALYFVSANGFIDNALKYALDHNVICYEKDNKGNFKIKNFWNK